MSNKVRRQNKELSYRSYLEDALFNAYSHIYLKETLLLGVNPREFRTSKAVLQMLKQMNVNVHEVHIATNTGFGELYSNF